MALALAALFIVLNGFFVSAEFALVKIRATQLHSRVRRGERRAVLAQAIVSRLDRYLSVTQFGITVASLALGWVGEPAVVALIEPVARRASPSVGAAVVHGVATVVGFGALTFAHILLGELVPKLVAIQRSEQMALVAAFPLRFVYVAFRPLLWTLEVASRLVLSAVGLKADVASEGTLSEDEILGILAASAARTHGGRARSELVERVLRFAERSARHATVPRVDVAYLPVSTSGLDALAFLRANLYSRVLVTKDRSLDEVVGYLYSKDFLSDPRANDATSLAALMREILFVPESRSLIDVLHDMQAKQTPIAVVVDEYGGTTGIVTMEDLLEEIVGEIKDELDVEPPRIVPVQDQRDAWDVDARATCEEVARVLDVHLGDEPGEPLGAVVVDKLARLPRLRDKVDVAPGLSAEVTGMSRRRVTKVRLAKFTPRPPPEVPRSRRPPAA